MTSTRARGEQYRGSGNEAEPAHDGSCCDDCNERYVIPARLEEELRAPNANPGDGNGGDCTKIKLNNPAAMGETDLTGERSRTR
jgi:hypothetical protein